MAIKTGTDLASVAFPVMPEPAPLGGQEFNKPMGTDVGFNSHNVADWSVGNQANVSPTGDIMGVVESCVTPPFTPNLSPGLSSQGSVGDGLDSTAFNNKPI